MCEQGACECAEVVVFHRVLRGGDNVWAGEAGEDGRYEGRDVGLDEEALIVQESGSELHGL